MLISNILIIFLNQYKFLLFLNKKSNRTTKKNFITLILTKLKLNPSDMGSLFDQCASRKNIESESILIENTKNKEFCQKFQNGCVTNVTLPSGFKVPQRKYGRIDLLEEIN